MPFGTGWLCGLLRLGKGVAVHCARLPHYVWVSLLLAWLLFGLFAVSRPMAVQGAFNVNEAEVATLNAAPQERRRVTLPHILDDEEPGQQRTAAYRLEWPRELVYEAPTVARLALLLPRVGTRFRVLLNGHELYNVGWYAPPDRTVNAAWFPYLVSLPAPLLTAHPADNRIEIQVQGVLLERSGLSPLQLGLHEVLAKRYSVLYGWQVIGTWMMVMTAFLMGTMALFLWPIMRERLFGLMAAASLAHTVRLVLSVTAEPPMNYELYFLLHRISFTVYCAFLYLFMEDLFGLKLRSARVVAYLIMVVGPFWMLLTLWTRDYDLYRLWAGVLALAGLYILGRVLMATGITRHMSKDQKLVGVVATFTLVAGLRDFLVVQLNFSGDADMRWMSIGSLALMFTLGWVLLRRSTESIQQVRHLNDTLADRIAMREQELRSAFEQLQISEQQRVIESERRRLMRDMHDGLGSQLVQALNVVRSKQAGLDVVSVESMIQHALEELRMTLDSLEPMEGDLPTILGTLRQRIAPALRAAGIELEWQVEEVPPIPSLDSQGVMHLFRCVQEAFANVVKHARAQQVTVRTWHTDGLVFLSIRDDGQGFQASGRTNGRGLNNIQLRAELIGAKVSMLDARPGVDMTFTFQNQCRPATLTSSWVPLQP